MQHVYRVQPKSIEELKSVVEDFSQAMDSQLIRKVCRSARTRFEMLQLEKGGRFEHKKQAYTSQFAVVTINTKLIRFNEGSFLILMTFL